MVNDVLDQKNWQNVFLKLRKKILTMEKIMAFRLGVGVTYLGAY